ncbi:MAG: SDR family oxidoreductase [Gemmatimonadetes bacterium]|nr:SDR family oxidoreductase [Gemmatimonadota bacterium]
MERVLIAGCGYVGSALAARLVADGVPVWGMRRNPAALPAGVLPFAADLRDAATLAGLPGGLTTVFYTAAADGGSDDEYRAAYVDGPRNLLAALVEQGQRPRRVIFTSSTSVYGQSGGEWVDEDSPTEPGGFGGRRMLAGESIVLRGPFPGVVLRLAGIYGPGRTSYIDRVRSGAAECPAETTYTNRIHRDDCAGALRHLMHLDAPRAVYLGVDEAPADSCEVLRWLAGALGVPEPRVAQDAGRRLRSNKRCRGDRLRAAGYEFLYPTYREGFGALL